MSPPSSISSSEARRYLALLAVVALLTVAGVCLLSLWGVEDNLAAWPDTKLLRFEVAKLDTARRIDVLLLGDSSLGNAIDTRAWSRATGQQVVSLALSGNFGYAGSLNMLRRVLRRGLHPRLVVIFQTAEMMSRPVAYDGLLYSAESLADLRGMPLWRLPLPLANLDISMSMLQALLAPEPIEDVLHSRDYIPQKHQNPDKVQRVEMRLTPAMIRPGKVFYLDAIGRLCRSAGLTCVYAHGPYVDPACSTLGPYIEAVDARVRAAGLRVLQGTPFCMPLDESGDAPDHVFPAFEARFSEAYLAQLEQQDLMPTRLACADAPPGAKPGRIEPMPCPAVTAGARGAPAG